MCTDPVNGTCPVGCPLCVCASPETPIATPAGTRPIAALRVGDLVYSVDHGSVVVVPIEAVRQIQVNHHLVRQVFLETGATLQISDRHPTADGRTFGDLGPGDNLDGIKIRDVLAAPYAHEFTYDILPASDTGTYFAGGALIGSTMAKPPIFAETVTAPMSE
jgi:hypothetical protein